MITQLLLAGGGSIFEKLTITSAFTTVLTSGYTPSYGQLSGINPDYLVFLHGDGNSVGESRLGLMNAAGVLQNTLEYTGGAGGVFNVKGVSSDNNSMYVIGDRSGGSNDVFIISTSLDGATVNWGRRLNYGTLAEEVALDVTNDYVYFAMQIDGVAGTVIGQLDKSDGALNWDAQISSTTFNPIDIKADETGVYLCSIKSSFGIMKIDPDGSKIWQKTFDSAITNSSGEVTGFDISADAAFVSGIDATDTTTLTVLKLSLVDGALLGQVNIDTGATSQNALAANLMPQNRLAYSAGKLIAGEYVNNGTGNNFRAIISDENLNIETNVLTLTNGANSVRPSTVFADNNGNWCVTGDRGDGSAQDWFISGVLEDGAASTGWSTTSRTVSTPTYTISNGSTALSDVAPSTNESETITVSSPTDLSTESW